MTFPIKYLSQWQMTHLYHNGFLIFEQRPKNGILTVHYGVEEITVNVGKMLKKFYWTYLLI
jgi:hypothetical protein